MSLCPRIAVLLLSLLWGGSAVVSEEISKSVFSELVDVGFDFVHFNGMSGEFYMAEINSGGGVSWITTTMATWICTWSKGLCSI